MEKFTNWKEILFRRYRVKGFRLAYKPTGIKLFVDRAIFLTDTNFVNDLVIGDPVDLSLSKPWFCQSELCQWNHFGYDMFDKSFQKESYGKNKLALPKYVIGFFEITGKGQEKNYTIKTIFCVLSDKFGSILDSGEEYDHKPLLFWAEGLHKGITE